MRQTQPLHILFLCTGNSARSILAEAIVNHLASADGRLRASSAGSHPKGDVHPLALALLGARGVPVAGLRSKSWDEFAGPTAPAIDLVLTVCDNAAAESCPLWPGAPMTAHWGVPDPAAVEGPDEVRRRAFEEAFHALRLRIERLASLPLDTLSPRDLQQHLHRIGDE